MIFAREKRNRKKRLQNINLDLDANKFFPSLTRRLVLCFYESPNLVSNSSSIFIVYEAYKNIIGLDPIGGSVEVDFLERFIRRPTLNQNL